MGHRSHATSYLSRGVVSRSVALSGHHLRRCMFEPNCTSMDSGQQLPTSLLHQSLIWEKIKRVKNVGSETCDVNKRTVYLWVIRQASRLMLRGRAH
ncbi:hypothetical protein U9M48_021348 [Paspalum notatum var. saurae]|uniref:Uncharacterized protein n=1 Tax=Paspalum notatum var. saurae TaxID=547442 RepID=A0AAQ3WTH3_PASNO